MSGSESSGRGAATPEALRLTVYPLDEPARGTAGSQRTRRGRLKMLLVLAVCAAPVVASYLMYFVVRPEGRSNYGTLILPTRPMPAAEVRSLDGSPRALSSLKGQWLLVVASAATCDPRCERLLYAQRQLREMLGRERDRIDKVWLITDEAPLRAEVRTAVGASPAVAVLRMPAAALSRWLEPAAGRALEDHLYLIDPMGEWMMRFPAEFEPGKVKRDLDRLLRASGSWDRAGR